MKTLQILTVYSPHSDRTLFENVAQTKKGIQVVYEQDTERVIDAINAQSFDLLVIDLDLPKADYHKLQKLVAMIYPDAAVTEVDMNNQGFINFKLDLLIDKWKEAQSDQNIRFFDLN